MDTHLRIRGTRRKAIASLCLLFVLVGCGQSRTAPSTPAAPSPTASIDTVDLGTLLGRWQRTDGSYLLDVRDVAPDGTVDVAYFNPRPINVGMASAEAFRGAVTLFVELDDVNYPGSSYQLTHDPERDVLHGTYHQATMDQIFEVFFARVR
jgi:hypothetical protein